MTLSMAVAVAAAVMTIAMIGKSIMSILVYYNDAKTKADNISFIRLYHKC